MISAAMLTVITLRWLRACRWCSLLEFHSRRHHFRYLGDTRLGCERDGLSAKPGFAGLKYRIEEGLEADTVGN